MVFQRGPAGAVFTREVDPVFPHSKKKLITLTSKIIIIEVGEDYILNNKKLI